MTEKRPYAAPAMLTVGRIGSGCSGKRDSRGRRPRIAQLAGIIILRRWGITSRTIADCTGLQLSTVACLPSSAAAASKAQAALAVLEWETGCVFEPIAAGTVERGPDGQPIRLHL